MKSLVMSLAAAALFVPSLALAQSDMMMTERGGTEVESKALVDDDGKIIGFIDTITETTTVIEHKPARSDTEYGANKPNPGTKEVDVFVREYTRFREAE